jgi:nucleoside-diphosphate-sugar epimerase
MSPGETTSLPTHFEDVEALEEFMTRPTTALVRDLASLEGDIMVLGVGGKMGPTLARLAKRAAPHKRVIGVARFSEPGLAGRLAGWGVECIPCDLLDTEALARLPRVANIVFMAGHKFGASGDPSFTWAMNTGMPYAIADAFRDARVVAFSTACVYPFAAVDGPGADESTPADPPPGLYAATCAGREQMFIHGSRRHGTPGRLLRLSYAIDMRYGVLFDVANNVHQGLPLDVTMGYVNVIWQGDANSQALRLLGHCTTPSSPINITGPERTSVRWLAEEFGKRLGKAPRIVGQEASTAWLMDTTQAQQLFGPPSIGLPTLLDWVARWVAEGKESLGKDTHFGTRDGKY